MVAPTYCKLIDYQQMTLAPQIMFSTIYLDYSLLLPRQAHPSYLNRYLVVKRTLHLDQTEAIPFPLLNVFLYEKIKIKNESIQKKIRIRNNYYYSLANFAIKYTYFLPRPEGFVQMLLVNLEILDLHHLRNL